MVIVVVMLGGFGGAADDIRRSVVDSRKLVGLRSRLW
jgi:hypothetical protein